MVMALCTICTYRSLSYSDALWMPFHLLLTVGVFINSKAPCKKIFPSFLHPLRMTILVMLNSKNG